MMGRIAQTLHDWIESGGRRIGEIHLAREAGGFTLRHRDDEGRAELALYSGAEAARELAHYDDAGKFRPLKTAPNLRHGWQLTVPDLAALRRALDYFYPAMLGVWCDHRRGALPTVMLGETLTRQTGMYRVTQKLTIGQAQRMIGSFCRTDGGCLKHILWGLAPGVRVSSLPAEKFSPEAPLGTLPLLCHEACNLLVAEARKVVKQAQRLS